MRVLPVINCPDSAAAAERIGIAKTFLDDGALVHLDVTDGAFSLHRTWNNPTAWKSLVQPLGFEVHLMTFNPEGKAGLWLAAGARKVIVHVETLTVDAAQAVTVMCGDAGAIPVLALNPETPIEAFDAYYGFFSDFQVLAVPPGPAGQAFDDAMLAKIATLRSSAGKNATIEVDGGINLRTARAVKDAGADVVVAGTFIFDSENPRKAYQALAAI